MTIRLTTISMTMLALGACNRAADNRIEANQAVPAPVNESLPAPPGVPETQANVTLPDDRTALEEPDGPIDPKSAEAAGQVVQHYGALIEEGRWTESWKLWSNPGAAKQFDRNWRNDSEVHMEIGKPGNTEGAAGSIYINVPVVFYGKKDSGGDFRRGASVILRRVNDVPGSTEAQRRWHIERIDWSA